MTRKVPSFTGLQPASESSSRVKRRNKRSNTKHEVILRRELWRLGLRYRKNVASITGKPDIVFGAARVLVFCDGDFWHGRNWKRLRASLRHRANSEYWIAKIGSNIARDKRVGRTLARQGWMVIRVWETDIIKNPKKIATAIEAVVNARRGRHAAESKPRNWDALR